jgi:hypothetical protein
MTVFAKRLSSVELATNSGPCAYWKLKDSVACLAMIGANCNAENVTRTLVYTHSACPTDLHNPKDQPANDRH